MKGIWHSTMKRITSMTGTDWVLEQDPVFVFFFFKSISRYQIVQMYTPEVARLLVSELVFFNSVNAQALTTSI